MKNNPNVLFMNFRFIVSANQWMKIFRLSVISGISELSGAEWKPTAGPFAWVQNQMMRGTDPRDLLKDMISADSVIPGKLIYRF